jgi:MFS superfamily sulfate permease-like transporter
VELLYIMIGFILGLAIMLVWNNFKKVAPTTDVELGKFAELEAFLAKEPDRAKAIAEVINRARELRWQSQEVSRD